MAQTLSGRNLRFYFNGSPVGMGRVSSMKPDLQIGLDAVKEVGTPTVLEYVPKVPETSISMGYAMINKAQLAIAMGQQIGALDSTLGLVAGPGTPNVGEVPSIPQSFDIVERRIKPGTEGTQAEVVTGYSVYQAVAVEKQSWDQEVDKLVAVDISGKCKAPRDYENINGIQFDRFIGNGSTTAFITTHKPIVGKDGYLTIRSESPYLTILKEGSDYTVASTASNATITYAVPPASSTAQNTLIIYAW